MRGALWKELVQARVPDEHNPEQSVPLIGDVAFLRNVRGMYQAKISLNTLIAEARRRHFAGIWPFQLVSAARDFARQKTWRLPDQTLPGGAACAGRDL